MFEVFIENFCKEKQAAWLEGCVEVYMAQYAKKRRTITRKRP